MLLYAILEPRMYGVDTAGDPDGVIGRCIRAVIALAWTCGQQSRPMTNAGTGVLEQT